ncbi:MAG: transposase [Chloroflexi bacterium]|nr:transposase [Chloroflexota bacterium]
MGRRTKLTPEVQEKICNFVRQGLTYEVAARAAGISESTFYRWRRRGEGARSGKFRQFWEALKKAEAEAESSLVQQIQKEARGGTWQAAAWILERRYPERWAKRDRVEHEHSVGDALAQVLERLADRGGAEDD